MTYAILRQVSGSKNLDDVMAWHDHRIVVPIWLFVLMMIPIAIGTLNSIYRAILWIAS